MATTTVTKAFTVNLGSGGSGQAANLRLTIISINADGSQTTRIAATNTPDGTHAFTEVGTGTGSYYVEVTNYQKVWEPALAVTTNASDSTFGYTSSLGMGFDTVLDGGSGGSFGTAQFPDYLFAFAPSETSFHISDSPSLAWNVTRADGGLVPVPTSIAMSVIRPDGATDTISSGSIYVSSSTGVASMQMGAAYAFTIAGLYQIVMSPVLNTGTGPVQTREVKTAITVLN